MAKVVLPLLGIEASGTIGKAFTYLRWKGETHVRLWKKPRNPKSPLQTRDRTYFMAATHFVSFVAPSSELAIALRELREGATTWSGFLIGKYIGTANLIIEAGLVAWDIAGNAATWTSYADLWEVLDKKHPQAEIDVITGGEILFLGANAAYELDLSCAPVAPGDMDSDQIEAFMDSLMLGGQEIPA